MIYAIQPDKCPIKVLPTTKQTHNVAKHFLCGKNANVFGFPYSAMLFYLTNVDTKAHKGRLAETAW